MLFNFEARKNMTIADSKDSQKDKCQWEVTYHSESYKGHGYWLDIKGERGIHQGGKLV